MPVISISGDRLGSKLYVYDGYVYKPKRPKLTGAVVLECKYPKCESEAFYFEGDDTMRLRKDHTHNPDNEDVDCLMLRSALDDISSSSTMDFDDIYAGLAPRYPYGAGYIDKSEAKKIMKRARDSVTPPVPLNLRNMNAILNNPMYNMWTLAHNSRVFKFFDRLLNSAGDILLFKCLYGCNRLPDENIELFACVINAKPRRPLAHL